ncbi:unnamed protein product [Rhizophagus irregularis]|nr:unnamed protein product [Rhizophagus irregularis]
MSYGKQDLLKILANHVYHSPEVSEIEDEGSKSVINVYDLSWRSKELRLLLRNVLDKHSYVNQPNMVYDTEYTGDDDDLNIDDKDLDAILADKGDKSESFMQED